MTHINYRWNFPDSVPTNLESELESFSPAFRSILYRRGCGNNQQAISFLLPDQTHYPPSAKLGHIDLAGQIITKCLASDQKIAVFGDYDADGITSTALLTLALQKLTSNVESFIPNRLTDGYGLNQRAIQELHKSGFQLLITVDNGIRSHAEIDYAKSLGLNVIITDHHHPPAELPAADAILNPKIPGDPYPNKHLAGVGVAYQLVKGLAESHPELNPEEFLDLVAIGTIADIVPLSGENRYLVKQGLLQMNRHNRPSIRSLLGISGLAGRRITASDISFQIGPRINASGRLADPQEYRLPLDLLLSTNHQTCAELAQKIELHNDRRKELSRAIQGQIEADIQMQDPLPRILISLDPGHHQGVAGIAAGYLSRKYYLPAIVGQIGPSATVASCRSIPEFDLVSALDAVSDLFTHYGGHQLAAGFTVENQNLDALQARLLELAELELRDCELVPTLEIDAVVSLPDLDQSLHHELLKLEPTGESNPLPIFVLQDVAAQKISQVGAKKDHLKFTVSDGIHSLPAIGFGLGGLATSVPNRIDLAFHFTENEFRGQKELQLQVLDIRSS